MIRKEISCSMAIDRPLWPEGVSPEDLIEEIAQKGQKNGRYCVDSAKQAECLIRQSEFGITQQVELDIKKTTGQTLDEILKNKKL